MKLPTNRHRWCKVWRVSQLQFSHACLYLRRRSKLSLCVMFHTPKWDYDASSESLYSQVPEPHCINGRRTQKKGKKAVKTNEIIKEKKLFTTKFKQAMQTPIPNVARDKTKKVKLKLMAISTSGNKMQNVDSRKIKNKGRDKRSSSYSKSKSHSFNDEMNICNSDITDAHLGPQKKRKWLLLSDSGSVQCKNKRKKISSNDQLLLHESNVSNKPTDCESNKEYTKRNCKKQNQKKYKKIINGTAENLSENFEKPRSASKSPYNIHKLKQMMAASNAKEELNKGSISEKKSIKETGALRERMMKRLQASRFRYLNEQLYTSGGKDAKEYFEAEPEAFQAYHEGYQQQVRQWPINPLDIIIRALKKKSSELVVADFGCGDAHLARSIPNKVHSFDLVARSDEVTACNMAHTPLSNASVDVVVFCLSLMGTTLGAYLTEANRVLKEGGLLKIAEVESRFEDVQTFIQKLQKFGFINTWKDLSHLFYFMDFKKERCISKKMKKKLPDLTLKPCLYKKR